MDFHVSLIGRKDLSGEIYRQMRRAILEGRVRPGERLPPTRELARQLSVARMTVTVAYDRLAGEGFVESHVGSGTFVSEHIASSRNQPKNPRTYEALRPLPFWDSIPLSAPFARRAQFDFRTGVPDASLFPHDRWRRLVGAGLRSADGHTGVYGDPAGYPRLREAIARQVCVARGMDIAADDVTIVSGTQQGLDVLARALLAPGDQVAVEDPGYPPVAWLLASLRARVIGVPVDRAGLVADALPRRARLVYLTPSHQFPLGVSMAPARRRALLEWATRNDAAIVEDDYDSEFRFEGRPLDPLQTLDTAGRVIYIGTFSKTMLPTLRLGFLVTPASLRVAVHKAKQVTDWHTAIPLQIALAQFIASGEYSRHVRKMREIYRRRRELVIESVVREFAGHLRLVPSVAGLHVAALAIRASVDEVDAVVRTASENGVEVQRLSRFAVGSAAQAGIVLGYGTIPTGKIQEGLRRLRRCFEANPATLRAGNG